ncbi:uncharacterized protein AC631_03704 [Debaryomyces fabryi]|uniref:BTB domain-containing protein n=1 Tax=Debaryomyces fabryi TaxID=58627 RepID=A0A0V1PWG0_9ASCO|nr:uncharacterized protein AC631_03704 [Debaryomyces fabryi]KSA00518.1 hypothetical protein AC631_03704 [Debaryomyces fabryi]CUM55197.1 unnamed protein product [Debaryomyces fabryi]
MLQIWHNHQTIAPPKGPDALTIYETHGTIPLYNTRATIVPCSDTDYVFLFGGFDELDNLDSNVYLLNMESKRWEVDDKHIGLFREGHLAVYIGQGNVLVFGGIPDEFPESMQRTAVSDDSTFRKDSLMMIYNVHDKTWIGPPSFTLNNAPSSRYRHACCLSPDGSKVYISGGLVDSMPLDDLYCYDLVSGVWSGPIKFVSRFDHYIKVYKDKIFAFGGLDKDMNHVVDCMTYISLNDQSIGKVSLLRKPVFNESHEDKNELKLANEYPYLQSGGSMYERIYTGAKIFPSTEIEISLPQASSHNDYNISYYDLADFKHIPLINREIIELTLGLKNKNIATYSWKHAFVRGLESLFLLGLTVESYLRHDGSENNFEDENNGGDVITSPSEREDDDLTQDHENDYNHDLDLDHDQDDDNAKLHSLLEIKLSDLGISEPEKSLPSMSDDFLNLLINEEFTDFEIITFKDEVVMEEYNKCPDKYIDIINNSITNQEILSDTLKSIKVHKSILLARWKHFRRLIDSGMTEAISNKMFIPEPYSWVRGLVFYLYTDKIDLREFELPLCTLIDYSGVLILSNLYELPQLRVKLLSFLYKKLSDFVVENTCNDLDDILDAILKIWMNGLISNEEILVAKIIEIIRNSWSVFIKSTPFMNLPKSLIIKLCQDCADIFPNHNATANSNKESTDNLLQSLSNHKTSDDSIENLHDDSNLGTPTSGSIRELHSNSPFLKTTNEPSPLKSPQHINDTTDFPKLQFLSNVLNDNLKN